MLLTEDDLDPSKLSPSSECAEKSPNSLQGMACFTNFGPLLSCSAATPAAPADPVDPVAPAAPALAAPETGLDRESLSFDSLVAISSTRMCGGQLSWDFLLPVLLPVFWETASGSRRRLPLPWLPLLLPILGSELDRRKRAAKVESWSSLSVRKVFEMLRTSCHIGQDRSSSA